MIIPKGISRRLFLLAVAPAAAIAVTLLVYFLYSELDSLDRALRDRGQTMATHLAPAAEYGVLTGNTPILERLASGILSDADVMAITILDGNRQPLIQAGKPDLLQLIPVAGSAEYPGGCAAGPHSLLFCAPIAVTRLAVSDYQESLDSPSRESTEVDPVGWVYVELSTDSNRQQRHRLIVQTVAITFGILLVTGLLAVWEGRGIANPIVALTTGVDAVASGNLQTRVEENAAAEILSLQRGVNIMVTRLQASQEDLQERVADATASLKRALRELEEKNADLEEQRRVAQEASQAKGRFLATMSHEIRTPIAGIIGMVELLRGSQLDSMQRDYLSNLDLSAHALQSLINDILDFSRIEAGKMHLADQPFSPRALATEVVLMMAPTAHQKGLEFVCEVQPDFPAEVRGDPLRVRQILINLIANAIKFTEHGEVTISAHCLNPETNGRTPVRFEIRDTGVGIDSVKLEAIFDSFTQVDGASNRRFGGSGLGTTIAKELVGLMGGRIGVESHLGRGSCFWVELPLQIIQRPDLSALVVPALRGQRLVVLESNQSAAGAMEHNATALGLECVVVRDETALEQALTEPAWLAVLAENSAEPRRLTLARRLKRDHPQLPLCHLTFFSAPSDDGLFALRLRKPVSLPSLRESLESFAERQQGIQTIPRPVADSRLVSMSLKVLLAEDNAINAKVIGTFLENAGHRPFRVTQGDEALEELRNNHYDLVLMDVRMPMMDGIEATRLWRAEESDGHIPIVALTANATTDDRDACLAAGMDDFLAKPVSQHALLQVLATWVA